MEAQKAGCRLKKVVCKMYTKKVRLKQDTKKNLKSRMQNIVKENKTRVSKAKHRPER